MSRAVALALAFERLRKKREAKKMGIREEDLAMRKDTKK